MALLVLVVVAWALVTGGDDPGTVTPDDQSPSQTEETDSESPPAEPTAEGMEAFITDYLENAPSDPRSTFEMLTPRFQEASGGYGGYSGYWNTIDTATPVAIDADPDALTVAYSVDYVKADGSQTSGDVVLGLVFRGGRYLIAEES